MRKSYSPTQSDKKQRAALIPDPVTGDFEVVVELHDLTPSHQVDFHFICESHPFAGGRRDSGGEGGRERRRLRGG